MVFLDKARLASRGHQIGRHFSEFFLLLRRFYNFCIENAEQNVGIPSVPNDLGYGEGKGIGWKNVDAGDTGRGE